MLLSCTFYHVSLPFMTQIRSALLPAIGDSLDLPSIGRAVVRRVMIGRLQTTIIRLALPNQSIAYLKEGDGDAAEDIEAEAERLEWLQGRLLVPVVRRLPQIDGRVRVLIEAVPGRPAHHARLPEGRRIELLAYALQEIHATSIDDCPFRDTLECELVEAERRLRADKLDTEAFVAATGGVTPIQALELLHADRSLIKETVFTHGDYCLPNVMIARGQLSGIIDWGLAGIADPHRDFMALSESITCNLGEQWVNYFFDAYGAGLPDWERIRYYTLLDQFFGNYVP